MTKPRFILMLNEVEYTLKPKTQILYVPPHLHEIIEAAGNADIVDRCRKVIEQGAEVGFVVSAAGDEDYFCRYWSMFKEAGVPTNTMRTKANSERTPGGSIFILAKPIFPWMPEDIVNTAWMTYVEPVLRGEV